MTLRKQTCLSNLTCPVKIRRQPARSLEVADIIWFVVVVILSVVR